MSDDLGDRMKRYEAASTARHAYKGQPLIVRLDGRAFHTFTAGMRRPYDGTFSSMMIDTTCRLVDKLCAAVGYTQSDEITLAWSLEPDSRSDYPFAGRFQKIESVSAALCSVIFNRLLAERMPALIDDMPTFDSRAFVVPTLTEAYNCFVWRQQDATKNAISMAAQSMFPHKELQNKNGAQMQEMMHALRGVNFNDYPAYFKRGTFARRETVMRPLGEAELAQIPERHRPPAGTEVERTVVRAFDLWLTKHADPMGVLFRGEPTS